MNESWHIICYKHEPLCKFHQPPTPNPDVDQSCHTCVRHVTYVCHVWMRSTGWQRCIGCLNFQVSFRKSATSHRALLRKMTYTDKASCGSSPPCTNCFADFISLKESCHTYEWIVSHINESCHIWMSHVTYEWVMSHMNEWFHIWISHVTYEWVTSHMNEPCHIWMSHVTYEWVMSHTWMGVMSQIWMSHTYECFKSHI